MLRAMVLVNNLQGLWLYLDVIQTARLLASIYNASVLDSIRWQLKKVRKIDADKIEVFTSPENTLITRGLRYQ